MCALTGGMRLREQGFMPHFCDNVPTINGTMVRFKDCRPQTLADSAARILAKSGTIRVSSHNLR